VLGKNGEHFRLSDYEEPVEEIAYVMTTSSEHPSLKEMGNNRQFMTIEILLRELKHMNIESFSPWFITLIFL